MSVVRAARMLSYWPGAPNVGFYAGVPGTWGTSTGPSFAVVLAVDDAALQWAFLFVDFALGRSIHLRQRWDTCYAYTDEYPIPAISLPLIDANH
ncbi:MAG: hypothetical protein ACRD19_00540 [Terriglobia bacterium]